MPSKSKFQALVEKRKRFIESVKENNFEVDLLLAGLYSDKSHFIFEILQNAEDEGAKKVSFDLFEDRLDIYHDGEDFDFDDIDGITGIGRTTKRDDLNKIGKFGYGFKSVFAVTQTPLIYSGTYSIKIEDYVVPSIISPDPSVKRTKITLPFNHPERSKEYVFSLIHERLEHLGSTAFLFLDSIQEIKWKTSDMEGCYKKTSNRVINGEIKADRVRVSSNYDEHPEEYLVVSQPFSVETTLLSVKVAYKLRKDEDGREHVEVIPNTKLIVYFPTERDTYLNFFVHGPFRTPPNRENITLQDPENTLLIGMIAELVAQSLSVVKQLGFLDVDFLKILPLDQGFLTVNGEYRLVSTDEILTVIHERLRQRFLSEEELLPTHDGKYTSAGKALLARVSDLPELLGPDDNELLFSRSNWLTTSITDRDRAIWDYLTKVLKIRAVDYEDFARSVTSGFFDTKPDDWMISFYGRLRSLEALWRKGTGIRRGVLRSKPIIRTSRNKHVIPFDGDENPKVYLPRHDATEYETVKSVLCGDEDALGFLKDLGLKQPDLYAEVQEYVFPKYQTADVVVVEADYLEDFRKIFTVYKQLDDSREKKKFLSQLESLFFLRTVDLEKKDCYLDLPTQAYLPTDELQQYFAGSKSTQFVSGKIHARFEDDEELVPFLKDCGVADSPRRIAFEAKLTYEEKQKLRNWKIGSRDKTPKDFGFDGLDLFLQREIDLEESILLWNLLLQTIRSTKGSIYYFFQGEYEWQYYSWNSVYFDAKFCKTLKENKWLIDQEGNLKRPTEITKSELAEGYDLKDRNAHLLLKNIGFLPDIVDQLPEEDRKRLEMTRGHSIEELEAALLLYKGANITVKEDNEDQWQPEVSPDDVVGPEVEEVNPGEYERPDLGGQGLKKSNTNEGEMNGENGNNGSKEGDDTNGNGGSKGEQNKPPKRRTKASQEVGVWGEALVLKILRKEHQEDDIEVVWLNEKGNRGKGYDIVLIRDNKEVEYIEVKSTREQNPSWLEITGTQWEFARRLYDQGEGDKYSIYIVLKAGSPDAGIKRVKNPIRLWKEGQLLAHLVSFKVLD